MNREDIVSRYRYRIATGKRTKLTDAEQTQLIEAFVERLRSLTTEAEIKVLCESELALLEEGYSKSVVSKDRLRHYRKVIKVAIGDGRLPMTEETSRVYIYTPHDSNELVEAHDHRALDYLKYDAATYRTIAEESSQRNNRKQDNLKPVSLTEYLSKASELLRSDAPFDLIVGVAALTGRRFAEVVDKGTLQATDDPYSVTFGGQTKKKEEADSYLIPCLIPSVDVLSALERFRRHPRISKLSGMSASNINRSLANSIKLAVQKHFGSIVPTLEGESAVTVHNLRGVYSEIAVHYFCPPDRGVARYVQERLGHAISEQELKRSNASAAQHYFHYFLIDDEGEHIGAKGVMLAGDEGVSTPIESAQGEPETQHETASATEPRIDQQDPTSAIAALSEQVTTLTQEVNQIWSHITHMSTQAPQAPQAVTDTTLLRREIETLRTELEQAKADNELLREQLAQTNQIYKERVGALTDLLKQAPVTTQMTQPIESMPTRAVADPAPKTRTPMVTTRQHITMMGSADQRIEGAMRTVMTWNRQHDSDSAKFAITQSLMQKCTGSNMAAVKRVMASFQNDIHEHNCEYGLDPDRHNYGKDLSEIKSFVQSRIYASG